MERLIAIDPITRLEGHGRIEILLDDNGEVDRVFLQIPDLRGFEAFCRGRAAEEMPQLIQKICGVCPTAHHTASIKALDDLFQIEPPDAARLIRELLYCAFVFEDHCLHFYYLGGPDFLVNARAPRNQRNVFGAIQRMGCEHARRLMAVRSGVRSIQGMLGGSSLYPVYGLPGGVARPVREADRRRIRGIALEAVELAREAVRLFTDVVLPDGQYAELLSDPAFSDPTLYMGMVDAHGRLSFCEGDLRVAGVDGSTLVRFAPRDYRNFLVETVDAASYAKPLFFKGFGDPEGAAAPQRQVYRVGPLARLNVADSLSTPLAREESIRMFEHLGGKPAHNLWAYHWARVIELLHAAERMAAITDEDDLTNPRVRNLPERLAREGFGACEAPRGTLIHHYCSDERGVIRAMSLLVATQNNLAAILQSITRTARTLIRGGRVTDEILNKVEMAFRAYDPCLACAAHSVEEGRRVSILVYDSGGQRIGATHAPTTQ